MNRYQALAVVLISWVVPAAVSPTSASAADIVARAEATELRHSDGSLMSRVERDADGHVTVLLLSDMQLTSEEIAEIGGLSKLRRLVLFRTNCGDDDVQALTGCRHLESLNLTGTEVTDAAIESILEFEQLKYLCLGNVDISPEAVARLKQRVQARGQELRMGYARRRP
jgi:hypothetical protein